MAFHNKILIKLSSKIYFEICDSDVAAGGGMSMAVEALL